MQDMPHHNAYRVKRKQLLRQWTRTEKIAASKNMSVTALLHARMLRARAAHYARHPQRLPAHKARMARLSVVPAQRRNKIN